MRPVRIQTPLLAPRNLQRKDIMNVVVKRKTPMTSLRQIQIALNPNRELRLQFLRHFTDGGHQPVNGVQHERGAMANGMHDTLGLRAPGSRFAIGA